MATYKVRVPDGTKAYRVRTPDNPGPFRVRLPEDGGGGGPAQASFLGMNPATPYAGDGFSEAPTHANVWKDGGIWYSMTDAANKTNGGERCDGSPMPNSAFITAQGGTASMGFAYWEGGTYNLAWSGVGAFSIDKTGGGELVSIDTGVDGTPGSTTVAVGTVSSTITSPTGGTLNITSIDDDDPIDIQFYPAVFTSKSGGDGVTPVDINATPFYPKVVADLQATGAGVLRPMNWNQPPEDVTTQILDHYDIPAGWCLLPFKQLFQSMIDLANAVGADLWVALPPPLGELSDAPLTELANMVLDGSTGLDGAMWCEYGNEWWLTRTAETYAAAQFDVRFAAGEPEFTALGPYGGAPGANDYTKSMRWQTVRSWEIWDALEAAGLTRASGKLKTVMAGQTTNPGVMDWHMQTLNGREGYPEYDVYAVGGYIGHDFTEPTPTVPAGNNAEAVAWLMDTGTYNGQGYIDYQTVPGWQGDHAALDGYSAGRDTCELAVYEGGQHFLTGGVWSLAQIETLKKYEGMRGAYQYMLDEWKGIDDPAGTRATVFCHYQGPTLQTGVGGLAGAWGLKDSYFTTDSDYPIFEEFRDWQLRPANAKWW